MTNKEVLICKEKILKCLTDDFKHNQAIFDKKEGWQVFNGTDLEMVMDKVVKGLKFAQEELRLTADTQNRRTSRGDQYFKNKK